MSEKFQREKEREREKGERGWMRETFQKVEEVERTVEFHKREREE